MLGLISCVQSANKTSRYQLVSDASTFSATFVPETSTQKPENVPNARKGWMESSIQDSKHCKEHLKKKVRGKQNTMKQNGKRRKLRIMSFQLISERRRHIDKEENKLTTMNQLWFQKSR